MCTRARRIVVHYDEQIARNPLSDERNANIYISSAVIFLERYDAYFYFNIVYNDLGKNVFHKKGAADRKEGDLRVSVLYSFISFFYLFIYYFYYHFCVQFLHTSSAVFAHFEWGFCTVWVQFSQFGRRKFPTLYAIKRNFFRQNCNQTWVFLGKVQPNAEKIGESAILRWDRMCSFARGLCRIEGRDGAAFITFPLG